VIQTGDFDSYYLLVPDLPSHGQSTSLSLPFNLSDTAALLADLITKHAKDGKAGLVAMSLGGYTSIYLASKYPELIGERGLFVSGCGQGWPPAGGWMSYAVL
jgi:pimeloyl-ACP methyl ester carboxylesterase